MVISRNRCRRSAVLENQRGKLVKIAGAFLFLSLLGYVGEQDFLDEQREFRLYCVHVFGPNPIWPDYSDVGVENCQEAAQ